MASSWIPHGTRSSMPVSSVLASARRRKLWRSVTQKPRGREREVELPPCSHAVLHLVVHLFVFDAISLANDTAIATRFKDSTRRRRSVLKSPDAPWTSFRAQFLPFPAPLSPVLSPAMPFFSGLHGGVICRHHDDDDEDDGESQLRENRALPGMPSARWLSRMQQFSKRLLLWKRGLYRFFVPAGLFSNSLRYSGNNEVYATSQWQSHKDDLEA